MTSVAPVGQTSRICKTVAPTVPTDRTDVSPNRITDEQIQIAADHTGRSTATLRLSSPASRSTSAAPSDARRRPGEASKTLEIPLNKVRVAIQCFGNVGTRTAHLTAQQGAKVVAVSDAQGGIFAENGLDVASVCDHVS